MELNLILSRKNARYLGDVFANIYYGVPTTVEYVDEWDEEEIEINRLIIPDAAANEVTMTDKFYDEELEQYVEGGLFMFLSGQKLYEKDNDHQLFFDGDGPDKDRFFAAFRSLLTGNLDRFVNLPEGYENTYGGEGSDFKNIKVTLIG